MAEKYNIKYFYDIQDRSNFKANPNYKGVCHIALAEVRQNAIFEDIKVNVYDLRACTFCEQW